QLLAIDAKVQEIRDQREAGIREIGKAETALERIEGDVRRLGGMFRELETRKKQLSEGREQAIQASEDAEANLKNVRAEFAALQRQLSEVSARLKEERKLYSETQTQVGEYDGYLSEYRRERDRLNDAIHTADIELHDLNHRIRTAREKIMETYEIDLTAPLQQKLELIIAEDNPYAETPLGELREKLRSIGAVNEMAVEEYEEIDRRYQDLRAQVNDLLSAKEQLEDTIHDINNIARDQFITTFERVNENFIGLFKRMFEGGEASLALDDGDPLEAGIRIYATPKGKKLSNIELMSGGEKALTAISLLFSLYMERPSPFCFLDEVDAPLDDVNVVRFNKLLYEFTKRTQFLMVTHNKLTMERTDRIYGITMEQEGISKLIAVQLGKMKDIL
ncbi:hypothetical protein K8I28_13500, partial [bacterium]|nr:hypothetical protein [bacterium]